MPLQLCVTIPDNLVAEGKEMLLDWTGPQDGGVPWRVSKPNPTNAEFKQRGQDFLLWALRGHWRQWRQRQQDTTLDGLTNG